MLRALLADDATARLDPVLVSGRTVACSRSTATALADFARQHAHLTAVFEDFDPITWSARADGPEPGWRGRRAGRAGPRCVDASNMGPAGDRLPAGRSVTLPDRDARPPRARVGTRHARTSSSISAAQPRASRSSRFAAARCVSTRRIPTRLPTTGTSWSSPAATPRRGRLRAVRAQAPGLLRGDRDRGDRIGVSHVDSALGPFGPPADDELDPLTARLLARPASRGAARAGWRIGEAYRDVPVETVRIRLGRSPGLPGRRLFRGRPAEEAAQSSRPLMTVAAIGSVGLICGVVAGQPLIGGLAG